MRTNLSNIVSAGSACPLFTAALALAITLTLASCGKGGGDVKLLESISDNTGKVLQKFEYDDKNRLVKIIQTEGITTRTITYNSDDLVTVVIDTDTTKYVIKGNTITSGSATLTIDKDGYIVTKKDDGESYTHEYQYKDGNLATVGIRFYTYDDKKPPFSNSNTPKWLLCMLNLNDYANKNNVLSNLPDGNDVSPGYNAKYEYDSEGFPIKRTEEGGGEDFEDYEYTILYTYRR